MARNKERGESNLIYVLFRMHESKSISFSSMCKMGVHSVELMLMILSLIRSDEKSDTLMSSLPPVTVGSE